MNDHLWQLDLVSLGGLGRKRLADVDVTIRPGVTAVIGWSGAGKTSLLNLLAGFERPDSGQLKSMLPDTNGRMPLFWSPDDHGLWPHLTARDHLLAVCSDHTNGQQPKGVIDRLLDQFDLSDHAQAHPDCLSQGQRSRLAVARALAAAPAVLLMDEPLEHVDPARIDGYWQVITEHIAQTACSLVFSTHSPELVLAHAQQVICLSEGQVVYQGDVQQLYHQPETPKLALCLGQTNWMEADEAKLWLDEQIEKPRSYRPQQIAIELDAESQSPFEVRSSTFAGSVAQVNLLHQPSEAKRSFWHRPAGQNLKAGDRVVIKVLAMLALMMSLFTVAGCNNGSDAELEVKEFKVWNMPAAGKHIPGPRSVAVGPDDQIVVLDNGGRLLIFDPQGKLLRKWDMPSNEVGNPEGACWLKDGRIAVADTHYHRVLFFDPQGKLLSKIGKDGVPGTQLQPGGPGTFIYPVSVVQDDQENIYVAEYGGGDRVQKFSPKGEFILEFGEFGTEPGQFQRAGGMVWFESRIYVTDTANGRIQIFSEQGEFLGIVGLNSPGSSQSGDQKTDTRAISGVGETPELLYPYDVEIGPDRAFYVIEWGANRVTKLSMSGKVLGRYGQAGPGKGQFRRPWGIAVDSKMRIRVADTENRRIVELRL
jgi:iron(III) transport system ATP-binding protein